VWRPRDLKPIFTGTLRESTMLLFIIGMSLLYSYVMSYLHLSQSAAEAIVVARRSRSTPPRRPRFRVARCSVHGSACASGAAP
jgi:hypothetical protein